MRGVIRFESSCIVVNYVRLIINWYMSSSYAQFYSEVRANAEIQKLLWSSGSSREAGHKLNYVRR
jgi:hypothetical protein